MSQENVEIARRLFAARNRSDIEGMLERAAPDVEFDFSRSKGPWAGIYRGHESLRESMQALAEAFDEVWWEAEEFIDAGDAVVVPARMHYRGRGSGVESVARGAQVYWFKEGKVVRFQQCQNRAEGLEAVGLQE
jgi:ketosteroid isomerase-like protein